MINSYEIILEFFFAKNHCEIQVRTILVYTLYLIKYDTSDKAISTIQYLRYFNVALFER